MTVLRTAYVAVRPDTTGFDADLRKRLQRIDASAQGRRIGATLAKGLTEKSSAFAGALAAATARMTLFGAAAGAAAPGVTQLTAALAPAAGALVALPAAMVAVKVASATVKLAVLGVGDAIETGVTGTAEEAAKAMEKLPTQARAFAREVVALRGPLADLRAQVSNRFFQPLVDEVGPLAGRYLPMLRTQMPALAESIGRVGESAARAAQRANVLSGVRMVFTNAREGIDGANRATGALVEGFGALLRVGAPMLQRLGESAGSLGERFGRFLVVAEKSGQLKATLQGGLDTLRELGAIAGNVGSIFGSVFSAANASGSSLLTNLRELTGQAAAFLRSGQGGSALTAVFSTLAQLGQAMRTALAAVLPAIAQSVQALAPAVSGLAPAFAQLVVAVAPLLPYFTQIAATILTKVTPAVADLADWLTQHQGVLKAVVFALGGFVAAQKAAAIASAAHAAILAVQGAGGLAAYLRGTTLVSAATKVWAGVQWILNAALTANPIGLVVAGLFALGAAAVVAYQKSDTFRAVVQAAWKGIQTAASHAWNNVIKPAVTALVGFFRTVIAPTAMWLWRNVMKPAFEGIGWAVKAASVVSQVALKAFHLYLTNVIFPVVRFLYNNVVKPIFTAIGSTISWWWNTIAKPTFNAARAGFQVLGTALAWVWNNNIKPMFNSFAGFLTNTVVPAFRRGIDGIRAAWDQIKNAARVPVAFVVNSVINPLIGGINSAAQAVGIKDRIPAIPGFAAGGRISGAPSSVDNRLAPARIPGVGAVKLAGGEFVVNARDTAKALPLLQWINAGMRGGPQGVAKRIGRPMADRPGDGSEGWAFADGGLVGWAKDAWNAISNPTEVLKKPFEAALKQIPGSGNIRDFLVRAARKLLNGTMSWLTGAGSGEGGGNVAKAQQFVRAQNGKPYIWADAGPQGYDCSGIVSAVYNVMRGKNPYSHTFSTGMLPGEFFRTNAVGPLMAGWAHPGQRGASANVGHMAGQIGNLPFESRGSRGVVIAGAARRINGFAHTGAARFAEGGLVPLNSFDSGGYLPTGLSLAHNGTGRPEPVGHHLGSGDIHFHFHGPVASKQAAEDMVVAGYNAARKKRRIP